MKTEIKTASAPQAIGPYSQAIEMDHFVFTSGQLPINAKTGEMPSTAAEQATESLNNVKAVLEAAGAEMKDVIKTTVFIKSMDHFAEINEVYAGFFEQPYPARSCVEVARLPKDALVEIEVIAVKDKG